MDSESFRLVLQKRRTECCSCIPARFVLTFLVFCGLFVIYMLRVNLSVSMVAMVNNSAIASSQGTVNQNPRVPHQDCPEFISVGDNSSNSTSSRYNFEEDGEFTWDSYTQSLILGAFYYGYSITQLPGGWISERWGGKWPFGFGIFVSSLFTVLTVVAARSGYITLFFVRMIKGLGEGVTYPAMYALFSRWAPLKERSLLIALASVGANLGTIVGMPISAFLCEYGFGGGWPSVFYICGFVGCIWFIPWALIAANRPTRHPRISDNELIYLKHALGPLKKRPPTPWKAILTSGPVWAVIAARFASYWGLFTLLAELPSFLRHGLQYDLDQNGEINAIIYTSQSIGMIAGGYLSDRLRTKSIISINLNRKIFEAIGCLGPAACLLGIPFAGCNRLLVVVLLTVGQGLYGFNAGGSIPAMVDMAPDLAGTVSGIVLTIASCSGFMAPIVAGKILQRGGGLKDWNIVFYIASGVYVVGALSFICCGSAEVQPWGKPRGWELANPTRRRSTRLSRTSLVSSFSSSLGGPIAPVPEEDE